MASDIVITPNRGSTTVNAKIDFTGASTASSQIRLEVLPDNSLAFVGTTGSLFSIADSVTGSLMSVNDASGLPILEVFDTDKVVMGQYNQNTLVVNGAKVGIGTASPTDKLTIAGVNSNGITFTGSNATLTSNTNLIGVAGTNIYMRPGSGYDLIVDTGNGINVTSGNIRAPAFYYSSDTNSRWVNGYQLYLRGVSPTIYFRDTDHNSAMVHVNSNIFYILRGSNDTESWSQVNGRWPMEIDLTNNNMAIGGNLNVAAGTGTVTAATFSGNATTATTATNWGSYGAVPAAGTSFGVANTIGRSDASGYAYFYYINSNTSNNENGTVSQFVITNGTDNFYRKASLSHVKSQMGLSSSDNPQFNSIGLAIAASGTAGSISLNQSGTRSWSITPTGGNLVFASGDSAGAISISTNLTVAGNLTVNGTTITVNSTTVTIDDPIFTLGGDTAPGSDDNKDRGIEFRWHNGSAAKVGFFGLDDSTGYFTFIPDATNTSEVFSGTQGDIQASTFRGNVVGGTLTAVGTLTINKSGTNSDIIFPAQTNDPGYIRHYESNNTAIMYFNVSDDTNDEFHFGYSGDASTFRLRSDGTVLEGIWQGSVIASTYGGTGVDNAGRTLTINTNSGTISFTNASTTLTVANNASVSGTNTGDQTTVSGNAGTATTWQTARNFTIGSTARSVNGSSDYSWTVADIGAAVGLPAYQAWSFDSVKTPGLYQYDGAIGATKPPDGSANYRTIEVGSSTRYSQIALPWDSDNMYFRRQTNSTWSAWRTVLTDGNYNSYSPTLTGTGASGTWGISITGNAATATSADQIDGVAFRNTGSNAGTAADSLEQNGITYVNSNISLLGQSDGALFSQAYNSNWQHQIYGDYRTGQIVVRGKNNGTWQSWRTVLDSTNYTSYTGHIGNGTLTLNTNSGSGLSGSASFTANQSGNTTFTVTSNATVNNTANTIMYRGGSGEVYVGDTYSSGWFRNYGNAGLYNQDYGNHWYATGNDYWNLAGNNASNIGIILRSGGHQGTIRGYVYADSNNHIGFLNNGGSWRLRVVSGDYTLAEGSSIRGQLFYDSNDTTYYMDPASTGTSAIFAGNITVANGRTDAYIYMGDTDEGQRIIHNNSNRIGFLNQSSGWGAWCDDSGYWQSDTSIRGPLFYDSNDTGFYCDPASYSNLKNINNVYYAKNGVYNNLGNPTVDEKALFHGQFNNKFRFWAPQTQEESTNGTTWTTSTRATSQQLLDLMLGEGQGTGFTAIPAPGTGNAGYYRLTWDATISGSPAYCFLDAVYCYNSTSGNNVTFTVEAQDSGTSSWVTIATGTISNWPGHTYIPHSTLPYISNGTSGYYKKVRLTFAITSAAAYGTGLTLYALEWWGGYPQGRRNVQYYDSNQNVFWPAKVYGTQFVDQNNTGYYLDPDGSSNLNTLSITGNTNLGNGNGDTVRIDDILYVGASDSGDSHLYFGEDSGNWYGAHWYWDSSYTHYWYSRNGGTDSTLMQYATNDTTKITFGRNIEFNNYGKGIIGTYASTRYQGVFAMGESYKLPDDGNGVGTLYGIAWSHPNTGGAAANLASHGMLILENGTFKGAWGGGRLVTTEQVRGTSFYDYNNTGYYLDPDGSSNLWRPAWETYERWNSHPRLIDAGGQRPSITSDTGYWTGTTGWGTSYGTWGTYWKYGAGFFDCWGTSSDHPQGSGYVHAQGIQSGQHAAASDGSTGYGWQMVGAGDAANRWWLRGKWGGTTRPWYEIALYNSNVGGNLYADAFYDSGNTGYYCDPASTSVFSGLTIAGNTALHAGNIHTATNRVLRALGGSDGMDFNTTSYNSMYYANIASSPNKPGSYGYAYGTILTFDPGLGSSGRAQFYVSHAGNDLCFRGGWDNNNSWQTWNRVLTDQQYTSYTLARGGDTMAGILYFSSNKGSGVYLGNTNTAPLQAYSSDGGAAFMSFHRSGSYAVNMGLDPDNAFRIGGWSASAGRLTLDMSGNLWTASSMRSSIFYDQDDTTYFINPATDARLNGAVRLDGSLGVGTAASGTPGEIRATNNITAYYSDDRLKTKLGIIENPIEKVKSLSGFYFEANETAVALGYQKKREVGVSAQEVQAVLPEIIAPAPIDEQYMTVRYEKLIPLLIEAIKEQQKQIEELKSLLSNNK